MGVATARTITLHGANGHLVDVQVDVSQGVVKTAMVGRPDASISEARDRCRAAVTNSGFEWPATRRVTILLSPADLPKRGPHFDLAIAVATLAASGKIPAAALAGVVFIGELSLDGRLRAVPGVLPMAMAASARDIACVVVPEPQAPEAGMLPGMTVLGARSLAQVVALLRGDPVPEAPPVPPLAPGALLSWRGEHRMEDVDLADVMGMADSKYALEVAAAGGHHVLLSGPKGTGKTTLAERLPGLLPDLTLEEALELSAIYSLAGCLPPGQTVMTRPPFRAPHHSATRTGVLGGGTGHVHPGEVSRAHSGALFLDEFPLFQADIIEGLREPLESGEVTIARGEEIATFPARAMVVLACNPCPCGEYHPKNRDNRCDCGEVKRREYRRKISGPIADRIDITRHVEPLTKTEKDGRFATNESSATVRARVARARDRQARRYAGTRWRLNSAVPGPLLRERWPLPAEAEALVDERVYAGALTRRGATRVHRLAWTVADLRGVEHPGEAEVDVALRLRTGEPLMLSALEAVGG
jgi:magnesium chelatase family protein